MRRKTLRDITLHQNHARKTLPNGRIIKLRVSEGRRAAYQEEIQDQEGILLDIDEICVEDFELVLGGLGDDAARVWHGPVVGSACLLQYSTMTLARSWESQGFY